MMRFIWVSFVFGLCVSLIWWPGMTTYEAIASIIDEERFFVSSVFESTLLAWIDEAITVVLHFLTGTPLPDGITSSVQYQPGFGDTEMMAAIERVSEKPYFQSLWALICLATHRLCLILCTMGVMLPVLGAVAIDALVQREIRFVRFRRPNGLMYRYARAGLSVMTEGILLVLFVPFAIPMQWLFVILSLYALGIFVVTYHFYKN